MQQIPRIQPIVPCKSIFATIFLLSAILSSVLLGATELPSGDLAVPASETSLTPGDCVKCHGNIVSQIEKHGEAHKTKVTCIDCHEGHPPSKRDIIPKCSKCHQDKAHFQLPDCLQCHTNPHTPLNISLTRNITFPCTTCHASQIEQLRANPSIHTTLDCTACHTKHGFIPTCFACHKGHTETMTMKDCLSCHKAHMPLSVTYDDTISSEFCGSCHTAAYELLGKSDAKHRAVACVRCHDLVHKKIPECTKCHSQPHAGSIIDKFQGCGVCHGIAHNLKLNRNDMFLGL